MSMATEANEGRRKWIDGDNDRAWEDSIPEEEAEQLRDEAPKTAVPAWELYDMDGAMLYRSLIRWTHHRAERCLRKYMDHGSEEDAARAHVYARTYAMLIGKINQQPRWALESIRDILVIETNHKGGALQARMACAEQIRETIADM